MKELNEGPLLARREESTAVLTLNRPDQRNALNAELFEALRYAVGDIGADPHIRAVVITGAGDRAFCAGADIRAMQAMGVDTGREWSLLGHAVFQALEDLAKPTIAAINGAALGGGCELALACDFRFMAETAQIGQPEIKLGLIPGWGGTQRLPRIVGEARAKDLVLTGRLMSAEEASRVGLVNGIAESGASVLDIAMVYARQFATLPPLAVAAAKRAIDRGADLPLPEANVLEAEQFSRLFASADYAEGIAAFLEKRAASFTGR
jgi:enoyl-CoA hydratase